MVINVITFWFIQCFCLESYGYVTRPKFNDDREQDLVTNREVQSVDAVKTTQFDRGDIIDCVDINRQPSLDHPLFKNHKVQRTPSVLPPEMQTSSPMNTQEYESGFSRKEDCPDGTIPIYRTSKDQMENAKNISHQMFHNIGRLSTNSLSTDPDGHQVFLKVNDKDGIRFYGATGSSSVYELSVRSDQSSWANIWIEKGPPGPITFLLAGWTADGGEKTGCYNLLCKGFIQVHPRIGPGTHLAPVSTIGGETFEIKFLIYQDPMTGNWWLVLSDRNEMLAYWPQKLVPRLSKAATNVAWGGISLAGEDGISPPMGSGMYPDGFYDHAAFFRGIQYLRKGLKQAAPSDQDDVVEVVDKSGCYGLQNDKLTRSDYWGYRFSFGGPGGSTCKH